MDVYHKLEGLIAEAIKGAHDEEVRVQDRHASVASVKSRSLYE